MYKNNLDKLLSDGYNLKSILLYGESQFFIDYYTELIKVSINSEDNMSLYFDEYNFQLAFDYLSQSSLFGDKNLLIIKTDKKIPKKEIDKIIEATTKNSNSYLIYQYLGSDFKTLTNSFNTKISDQVRFFNPTITEALVLLNNKAKKLNLNIDNQTLKYLYDLQEMNLSLAINELNKLAIIKDNIDIKTIDNVCFNLNNSDINSIIYEVLDKKDFKEHLFKILQEGEDEIRFITTFTSFLLTLVEFSIHARLYGQIDSKVILGYKLPKHIEQKYIQYTTKINISMFQKMIELLQYRELQLKQSIKIDKDVYLYTTLSKIQTLF